MLSEHLLLSFIFSFSLVVASSDKKVPVVYPVDPCESVRISVTISQASDLSSKAEVVVKGGKKPFRYLFCDSKSEVINQDFKNAVVESLKPGKYTCMVRDATDCRKLIEFQVK
jgi:hypothetical protein